MGACMSACLPGDHSRPPNSPNPRACSQPAAKPRSSQQCAQLLVVVSPEDSHSRLLLPGNAAKIENRDPRETISIYATECIGPLVPLECEISELIAVNRQVRTAMSLRYHSAIALCSPQSYDEDDSNPAPTLARPWGGVVHRSLLLGGAWTGSQRQFDVISWQRCAPNPLCLQCPMRNTTTPGS